MMGFSLPHMLILAFVAILLFGGGRISGMMGDVAKGIKTFKKSMMEDDEPAAASADAPRRLVAGRDSVDIAAAREPTGNGNAREPAA